MDRQLLEQSRALIQRFVRIERDIRFLKRRVRYPGAIREREIDDQEGVAIPSTRTVGTLDLTPGRWLILASATLKVDHTVSNGSETIVVTVDTEEPVTQTAGGADSAATDFIYYPAQIAYVVRLTAETSLAMTVTLDRSVASTADLIEMRYQAVPL